ncbi:MAG: hypothetical protein ICV83_10225, partial [Cytophagales bacterium]|nr:hypothetical protein [Cytophagales bacterium]
MSNQPIIASALPLLLALFGLLGGLPEGRGQNRGITIGAADSIFYSPNPKNSSKFTFDDVLRVDLHKLINEKGATSKGIIGDVPGGSRRTSVPTGNPIPGSNNGISIEMYTYDSTSSTGEGKFLFGLYATATFTTYDWQHWNVPQSVAPYYFRSYKSDDIEGLALKAGGSRSASRVVPVVFKARIKSATLKSFAIPHLGSFDAWGLFKGGTFPKPNGMVAVGCHRGYWEGVKDPENTYNAVGAALARNFEIVELDMWRTSDNQVVVFHDMGLNKRTTSTGPVNTRTLAELRTMNVRNRFDELISDVSGKSNIRSLADVFA